MSNLIDRDELLKYTTACKINGEYVSCVEEYMIMRLPTVDTERHGRYTVIQTDISGAKRVKCSECGDKLWIFKRKINYCRKCGAKMEVTE